MRSCHPTPLCSCKSPFTGTCLAQRIRKTNGKTIGTQYLFHRRCAPKMMAIRLATFENVYSEVKMLDNLFGFLGLGTVDLPMPSVCCHGCLAGALFSTTYHPGSFVGYYEPQKLQKHNKVFKNIEKLQKTLKVSHPSPNHLPRTTSHLCISPPLAGAGP